VKSIPWESCHVCRYCIRALTLYSLIWDFCTQGLAGHTALILESPMPMDVQEGTFVLPESASILRYLATTSEVPDHWYPRKACLPCVLQMCFVSLNLLAGGIITPHQLFLYLIFTVVCKAHLQSHCCCRGTQSACKGELST